MQNQVGHMLLECRYRTQKRLLRTTVGNRRAGPQRRGQGRVRWQAEGQCRISGQIAWAPCGSSAAWARTACAAARCRGGGPANCSTRRSAPSRPGAAKRNKEVIVDAIRKVHAWKTISQLKQRTGPVRVFPSARSGMSLPLRPDDSIVGRFCLSCRCSCCAYPGVREQARGTAHTREKGV